MGKKSYLAFDFGASSGRAIIGQLEDGKMTLSEVHRFANGPIEVDGELFWDFNLQVAEIKEGIKKALATGAEFSSIAIDTWGVDYVLFKKDGSAVRLPYHYRDARTEEVVDEIFSIVSEKEIYDRAGIQMMPFNTLYQLYAHKKAHPEDLEGATLLMIPDAMTYMLCGAKTCEYSEASTSNLLDAKARSWDFELIRKLGIPEDIFPEIVPPCSSAGVLTEEVQKELGCGPIPVVKVGAHDTASAVASVPAPTEGDWAYISCGTWALLGAELAEPYICEAGRTAPLTNEGGLENTIRYLTNIMGTWLFQETKRIWNEAGKKLGFPEIENMAKETTPLKYLVNPNDSRFLAPGDIPGRVVEACRDSGQGDSLTDAEISRCIYDSLALCFREKLENLGKILGANYACLNIVGGGTKDKFLMQLASNAIGIPVVAGPVEATSIGNIVGQAIAAGDIASVAAGREIIKQSFNLDYYQPDASVKADWDAAFAKFKAGC